MPLWNLLTKTGGFVLAGIAEAIKAMNSFIE